MVAAAKHKEAYGSHLPVLIAVARLLRPRRLLELGAGLFSTAAFADKALFPTLEGIVSLEDDPKWLRRIEKQLHANHRVGLKAVRAIPDWVATADLAAHDLIFIDNGRQIAERVSTIRAVLCRARSDAVIVVHDFQYAPYKDAVTDPWTAFSFDACAPSTGIIFQDAMLLDDLKAAEDMIKVHLPRIQPSMAQVWAEVFNAAPAKGGSLRFQGAKP
jgi:hypothetical protein